MNAVALPTTVADIIDEYMGKDTAIEQAIADFKQAYDRLGMSAAVQGVYVENAGGSRPYLHASSLQQPVQVGVACGVQAVRRRHVTSAMRGYTSWRGSSGTIRRCRGIGGRGATAGMIPIRSRS